MPPRSRLAGAGHSTSGSKDRANLHLVRPLDVWVSTSRRRVPRSPATSPTPVPRRGVRRQHGPRRCRGRSYAPDRASSTAVDPVPRVVDETRASNHVPVLADNREHNPIAEVTGLPRLEVQLLVEPEPLDRGSHVSPLDPRSGLPAPPRPRPVFGDVAHHPVEVPAIQRPQACSRTSSTRSGVVDSSDIAYPRSSARRSAAARASSMSA